MNGTTIRSDILAGIIVFLVALPMNLGIAQACGLPPVVGVVTGITGGLLVTLLSPSRYAVSGPEASMVTIILGASASLGSWPLLLTAIVLAGVMQLLMGWLKAGRWITLTPAPVIAGMLMAIGIMLITQQIPVAMALNTTTFSLSPGSLLLATLALIILFGWELPMIKRQRILSMVPAALIAVLAGALGLALMKAWTTLGDGVKTVTLPELSSPGAWSNVLSHPDWHGALTNPQVWLTAVNIALVASLVTLLSQEALKKLKTQTPPPSSDRELYAQGAGNILSGLCGGLPVTSVIVRSSVNVNAGARTRLSAIVHCLLLMVALFWLSGLISLIPMPVLASILIASGCKLAAPGVLKQQWRQGVFDFASFLATLGGIISLGVLSGIALGVGVQVLGYTLRSQPGSLTAGRLERER
ncbi:SulP family inorganic anion transporter [Jejubacter calystegiae]|uniref:SulP family inorganic anion transporter n=1 Tax=Jejubacter calystegiae TaxID=2579935 RepID=A0A4P8YE59_9ENTR|nr:SulP family inorganic anion transporter [Jejubacter calystegiae]QCT18905.1 SulP family inorganic anion transporter [Jejubacter calystegiae]